MKKILFVISIVVLFSCSSKKEQIEFKNSCEKVKQYSKAFNKAFSEGNATKAKMYKDSVNFYYNKEQNLFKKLNN
jgi:hypothetical protein